jgi:soluble P-type ATPase
VAAIGQGVNDAGMLTAAGLGTWIFSPQGNVVKALLATDLVMPDIFPARKLFNSPSMHGCEFVK